MIVTVTLNPAFDHLLFLPELKLGDFNRSLETMKMPGGKGINVASSLAVLGEEVVATGFLGAQGSRAFERNLRKMGVTTSFIYVDQEIRTDFLVVEKMKQRQSLIVEKGTPIEPRFLNSFKSNLERLLSSAQVVEFGGSFPGGVSPSFLKELIISASKKGVKIILNLKEKTLLECMRGTSPFIVCPDLRESKRIFGEDVHTEGARKKIAGELLARGAEIVILKYGNLNYLVATKGEVWEGEIGLSETCFMIGIRDAVLAGFTHKYLERGNIGEALTYSLAVGRSAAKNKKNYPNSKEEVRGFLSLAKTRKAG